MGRTHNSGGKRAGFCRSARPLVRPGAFILPWPAVTAADPVDSDLLSFLLVLLLVLLDGVDLVPGALAVPVREPVLMCFHALVGELLEALVCFKRFHYRLRFRFCRELLEEGVLEKVPVYIFALGEQVLQTVGAS